jgi:hypothetical protein
VKISTGRVKIGRDTVKIGTGTVNIGAAKTIVPLRTYKNYNHASTLKIHDF